VGSEVAGVTRRLLSTPVMTADPNETAQSTASPAALPVVNFVDGAHFDDDGWEHIDFAHSAPFVFVLFLFDWLVVSEKKTHTSNRAQPVASVPLRMRGDEEWAPPRRQIVFHLPPKKESKTVAITNQHNRCAGCGLRVTANLVKVRPAKVYEPCC
jgi:hypothetical protein